MEPTPRTSDAVPAELTGTSDDAAWARMIEERMAEEEAARAGCVAEDGSEMTLQDFEYVQAVIAESMRSSEPLRSWPELDSPDVAHPPTSTLGAADSALQDVPGTADVPGAASSVDGQEPVAPIPVAPIPVPRDLASMPPGPRLSRVLTQLPVGRVSGYDTVEVLKARYRQSVHERAEFLRAVLETGLRKPDSGDSIARFEHPGEFAAEETRAALVWSRRRADDTFSLAWDVYQRLPMLGEAMCAGVLDEPRAQAFSSWTTELRDDLAAQVCAELLPEAPGLTVGQLIDRIKRLAVTLDPEWAKRRYKKAVRERKVFGSRNGDGTANVVGQNLPIDRAAAACDRVDVLARRCKRDGDTRPISHIRCDLYLGMLDGTFEAMNEDQVIAYILANPFTDAFVNSPSATDDSTPAPAPSDPASASASASASAAPATATAADPTPTSAPASTSTSTSTSTSAPASVAASASVSAADDGDDRHDGRDAGVDDGGDHHGERTADVVGTSHAEGRDPVAGDEVDGETGETDDGDDGGDGGDGAGPSGGDDPGGDGPDGGGSGDGGPSGGSRSGDDGDDGGSDTVAADVSAGRPWSVRELRIGLGTLLGLDERAAEIAGWDYVPAELGRQIVTKMSSAEWRWAICDRNGYLLDSGITLRRPRMPSGAPRYRDIRRGGIVELQISVADMDRLAAVASDESATSDESAWAEVIRDIVAQHACAAVSAPRDVRVGVPGDVYRRVPGASLRRFVQIRDRRCTHPSCRAPATRTDQDHVVDYADGGLTTDTNLGCCCRHDHRLKHDGRWQVDKPDAHVTVWTSPLGHAYINRAPVIIPVLPRLRRRLTARVPYRQHDDGPAGRRDDDEDATRRGDSEAAGGRGDDESAGGQRGDQGNGRPHDRDQDDIGQDDIGQDDTGQDDTGQDDTGQRDLGQHPGWALGQYEDDLDVWSPIRQPLRRRDDPRVLACGCLNYCACAPIMPPASKRYPTGRCTSARSTPSRAVVGRADTPYRSETSGGDGRESLEPDIPPF